MTVPVPVEQTEERAPRCVLCACRQACGDVMEADDSPRAVCKGLPMDASRPYIEIILERRGGAQR